MPGFRSFYYFACRQLQRRRYRKIFNQFRNYTMIPCEVYVENLLLAERVRHLSGCVVECGVWRGGMIAGIGRVLGKNRTYFLFDSFEGLPAAKEIDGNAAINWQKKKDSPAYYENCFTSPEYAKEAMSLAGITSYHLVKGWFDATLPKFIPPEPIAILRLDADWYDSTMVCLESFFDYVVPGGLILIDDYYAWDGCSRALHDFLSRRSAVERIRSIGQVCYLNKVDLDSK